MSEEEIDEEIKKLEAQQREIEVNYHRLAGAIVAYQRMKERLAASKTPANVTDQQEAAE